MSPLALSLRFLQTQSDEQLAALARAGHERAFEALVRRYRRPLLAYCRRIGSPQTNPEDTLQQGLLQAWSAIRTGVEVREPRAWLYRIVHNVSISNHRRPVLVPVEMRDTAGANGADFEAEQRMAARDALAGLAALPDLQREVMVGTAVDGMSHDELASALGLSSGAVRGLIYRARATLRAAAAAITPGPLISWALRSGSGPGSGFYEALAGGGTAGIGGILVKGGAIAATAGAIATATGISTSHKAVHHPATPAAAPRGPRREPAGIRRFAPGARRRPDELAHRLRSRIGPADPDVSELRAGKQRWQRVCRDEWQARLEQAPRRRRRERQLGHRRPGFGRRRLQYGVRLRHRLEPRRLGIGQRIEWLQLGNRFEHEGRGRPLWERRRKLGWQQQRERRLGKRRLAFQRRFHAYNDDLVRRWRQRQQRVGPRRRHHHRDHDDQRPRRTTTARRTLGTTAGSSARS